MIAVVAVLLLAFFHAQPKIMLPAPTLFVHRTAGRRSTLLVDPCCGGEMCKTATGSVKRCRLFIPFAMEWPRWDGRYCKRSRSWPLVVGKAPREFVQLQPHRADAVSFLVIGSGCSRVTALLAEQQVRLKNGLALNGLIGPIFRR